MLHGNENEVEFKILVEDLREELNEIEDSE